jgi:hypothetical protein
VTHDPTIAGRSRRACGGDGVAEWTTGSYDAQRTASIKNDPRISVRTMQKPGDFGPFKFLWKLKLE